MQVSGKSLKDWGLPGGPAYRYAMDAFSAVEMTTEAAQEKIRSLVSDPTRFVADPVWGSVATAINTNWVRSPVLLDKPCHLEIYGKDIIDPNAVAQMEIACRLPISVQAALMPDAHYGYSIPIGGVLATDGCVVPFAVGVDIGCRMQLTVFEITEKESRGMDKRLCNILRDSTQFGVGCECPSGTFHPVLDDERFNIPALKKENLLFKATAQVGTSGSGNHFAEFGFIRDVGSEVSHLAILTHSGSRGFGAKVAKLYTDIAREKCRLPKEAAGLAWLSLDDEAGQEYWQAMNLAGDYAKACHDIIHDRIRRAVKAGIRYSHDNHHNFAWKETLPDGRKVVVHRKGATPAGPDNVSIIPGSMSTPSYLVRGKGDPLSLSSSSHGAGRLMSRKKAKESFTMSAVRKNLEAAGVILLGGTIDECSMAYKDISKVMDCQKGLVEIMAEFRPWIVRMSDGPEEE